MNRRGGNIRKRRHKGYIHAEYASKSGILSFIFDPVNDPSETDDKLEQIESLINDTLPQSSEKASEIFILAVYYISLVEPKIAVQLLEKYQEIFSISSTSIFSTAEILCRKGSLLHSKKSDSAYPVFLEARSALLNGTCPPQLNFLRTLYLTRVNLTIAQIQFTRGFYEDSLRYLNEAKIMFCDRENVKFGKNEFLDMMKCADLMSRACQLLGQTSESVHSLMDFIRVLRRKEIYQMITRNDQMFFLASLERQLKRKMKFHAAQCFVCGSKKSESGGKLTTCGNCASYLYCSRKCLELGDHRSHCVEMYKQKNKNNGMNQLNPGLNQLVANAGSRRRRGKYSKNQKPVVMFSGYSPFGHHSTDASSWKKVNDFCSLDSLVKMVKKMGGRVWGRDKRDAAGNGNVTLPNEVTHVIGHPSKNKARTKKILDARVSKRWIMHPKWISWSYKKGGKKFLNESFFGVRSEKSPFLKKKVGFSKQFLGSMNPKRIKMRKEQTREIVEVYGGGKFVECVNEGSEVDILIGLKGEVKSSGKKNRMKLTWGHFLEIVIQRNWAGLLEKRIKVFKNAFF